MEVWKTQSLCVHVVYIYLYVYIVIICCVWSHVSDVMSVYACECMRACVCVRVCVCMLRTRACMLCTCVRMREWYSYICKPVNLYIRILYLSNIYVWR